MLGNNGKREWRRTRSSHARVLEGLSAAIAAHPSSGLWRSERNGGPDKVRWLRPVEAVSSDEAPDDDDPEAA